jgi:colanic acid biosynthesis glycosyl transferase WcaI
MRLTIINQFYVPDISPTAHLAASLAEHRALVDEVTIIASSGGYVAPGTSEQPARGECNPRIVRIWTPQLGKSRKLFRSVDYAAFYCGAALRMLMLPRQDVIVSLTTPPFIALTAVLHKLLHPGTKLVLWNMDCYPEVVEGSGVIAPRGILARAMRWLNRRLFARLEHLVTLDPAMHKLLTSSYAPRNRQLPATIIPNWERASFFPAGAQPSRWQEAEALGLRDRFVVLYLGNTGYGHSFDTVLDAAEELRAEPVTFLFIGGGSRWRDIAAGVAQRALTNVVMRDYVPKEQTPAVMAAADCALITLQDFALGVMSPSKLHANLAMGLPIIYVGPRQSNVDQAIEEFQCGLSVRHGEAARLADWIRSAIASPEQVAALRVRARHAFDSAYCDTQALVRFDSVLDGVRAGGCTQTQAPGPASALSSSSK